MELYLHAHYKMLIHLHIVMFQEFVRTLKEACVDEIISPPVLRSDNALVKHEPFSALDRFKPKKKKKKVV